MSFFTQLRGFFKRNLLLKYRNKFQTFPEIYNPITILAVLIVFNYSFKPTNYEPVTYEPSDFSRQGYLYNFYVLISPNDADTRKIGALLKTAIGDSKLEYFNDTDSMKKYYKSNIDKAAILDRYFGVSFDNATFPYGYTIYNKWDNSLFQNTKVITFGNGLACRDILKSNKSDYLSCAGNLLANEGFSYFQSVLNNAIKQFTDPTFSPSKIKLQLMPKGSYVDEAALVTGLTSYYLTIFFINSLITFVVNVVSEKEKKIKEVMRIMGMYDSAFWLSWILLYLLAFSIFNIIISVILFSIGFFRSFSLTIVFFVLFELYSVVTITFGMMFSTFFSKSKTAASACAVSYSLSSLIYFAVFLPRLAGVNLSVGVQWVLALIFPCAFSLAIDEALFAQATYGSTFPASAFFNSVRPSALSVFDCMIMLLVDGALYFLLTMYFDNVIQGEYGTAKPFWFFLNPAYWKEKQNSTKVSTENSNVQSGQNADFEPVPDELKPKIALRINGLIKTFKNEDKETYNAIDNLTLDIYSDQITAILGHNGAGKTTLFNILTGLIKPDGGKASFYQYNILSPNDLFRIRKMCGICPQQDVIYDLLNPAEHLELYAKLKGIPDNEIQSKIDDLLKSVDLFESRKTMAKDLSGGQKRKLCILISLIGDPKILILDEPTSGMDPTSRRAVWTLLQNIKKDRVILLTTHFMDEADLLADRKAILTKGRVRCVGSSLFLKNRFGLGYHLNCIGKNHFDQEPERVTQFIAQYVPECKLDRFHANEVSYTLPLNSISQFQLLFEKLEHESQSIGIEYFAISMTTLEEVFLKLGEMDDVHTPLEKISNDKEKFKSNEKIINDNFETSDPKNNQSQVAPFIFNFIPVHIYAILKLRFLLAYKNKLSFIYRFVSPLPMVFLAILLPKFISSALNYDENNLPKLNLQVNAYATEKSPFTIQNNTNLNLEPILGGNLIVNNELKQQPIRYTNSVNVNGNVYAGFIFNSWQSTQRNDITLLYNDSAMLAVPYLIQTLSNFVANVDKKQLINASISAWPRSSKDAISNLDYSSFTALIVLGTGLIMPLASFAAEIVQERENKCRSQIRLSGCSFANYWVTTILGFLGQFILLPIILFAFIYAVPPLHVAAFMNGGAALAIFLTTIIYVPCILIITMVFSFVFSKKETAMSALTTIYVLLFIVPYLGVNLSQLSSSKTPNIVHLVCSFIDPIYGFIGTYNRIAQIYTYQQIQNIIEGTDISPPFWMYFEFKDFFIPITLIFGLINIVIYSGILYFIESYKHGINLFNYVFEPGRLANIKKNNDVIVNEDSDVSHERSKILNSYALDDSPLILQEIRKEFQKPRSLNDMFMKSKQTAVSVNDRRKVALRNLTVSFKRGEIFGLLGPNGAGKTTAINIITTELQPDAGMIKILNEPVSLKNLDLFCANVGICPQHNPLWDELTLREHLHFYACIKRLPRQVIVPQCNQLMETLGITEHSDKKSKDLSGGTKRKLTFAISTFASPTVVLLDEPSTGLDPQSKRTFWNVISETFSTHDKCAILTTHSMEEAEALCQRIGIVVKGELKCLGSSQFLKEKFGMGYTLEAKINNSMQDEFSTFINELFMQQATPIESFSNRFVLNIPRDCIKSLAHVFERLEKAKINGLIIEYNFSQCTLEQVFIKFAKEQETNN